MPNKKQKTDYLKRGNWLVNDFIEFLPARNLFSIKIILQATSLTFAAGIVLTTVSQIASTLQCDWNLTLQDVSLVSMSFFLGEVIGSYYFGLISDTCGRKKTLMASSGLMVYFILLSAASPSWNFFLVTRLFTGAGYSGKVVLTFIYFTEFAKKTDRGLATLLYILIFTSGTLFAILMSYLTLNGYGWRFYVAVSNIIGIVFLPLLCLLPESMRFLQMYGRTDEIKRILNQIATTNNITWPSYALLITSKRCKQAEKGFYFAFKTYKLKLMSTCIVYLTILFNFYGLPFFILYKLRNSDHCDLRMVKQIQQSKLADKCTALTNTEVLHSLYINSGMIPGAFISYLLAERFGRKTLLNVSFVLLIFCYLSQFFCLPASIGYGLLFVCSGVTLGASCYVFTYISELFPTNVRATASGIVSSFGKLTCVVTPFVFQQLLPDEPALVLVGIPCMSFVALASLWFLPETLNKDMD